MSALLLRRARVAGHDQPVDILIAGSGRIERIAPHISAGVKTVDLGGRLAVPGLVDAHQHLDKTRTLRSVPNPEGTLLGAINAFKAYAMRMDGGDIAARAERTIAACLERGTVAIRTHVNVDPEAKLRGVEAMVALRERVRDRMRIQVVAFLTGGGTKAANPGGEWLDQAMQMGADVVGLNPNHSDRPLAVLDMAFAVAERHGKPIDLHLDEHLDANRTYFLEVAKRTRAHGMAGKVVASHSSALSALEQADAASVIDAFAEAGVGVVTLPAANLFLQGRDATKLAPRGLTRVTELQRAGVTLAAASDNIQDPFVPPGTGDLLEIARWALLAGHLGSNDLGRAFEMITSAPARLMGLDGDYGVKAGARADLLITHAEDAPDLVASGPLQRTVLVNGRVVAGSL
ncbi:MAG TPA: amidohydrolase family protein [Burkholderiales bacterium]|nr:amidohydrolase family protein [Burkholderiales bacterium]